MKERSFIAPARYIQGAGVINRLHTYVSHLGNSCLVILSEGGKKRMKAALDETQAAASDVRFCIDVMGGECCMNEINRLTKEAQEFGAQVIVGIGGGKVLDTAKAVAHFANLPVIVAPTTASSDAPCSALAVVYHENGSLDQLLLLRRNPDTVLVDTGVIVKASPRLFAAGLGDALATYYEMRALKKTDGDNFFGAKITLAAEAIATKCGEVLLEKGPAAYDAIKVHALTRAVEDVIEANTLLSGLGFESGGTSGAHPINNGIAELPQTAPYYHGEKVAFALLCQLVMENAPREEMETVLKFLTHVGLPVTLADLGIENIKPEELRTIAEIANSDNAIHHVTVEVDVPALEAAIIAADALGRQWKESGKLL